MASSATPDEEIAVTTKEPEIDLQQTEPQEEAFEKEEEKSESSTTLRNADATTTTNNNDHNPDRRDFPDEFYDPTTGILMKDPVVDSSGDSHERTTLLQNHPDLVYYPNRALKSIMDYEMELSSGSFRARLGKVNESFRASVGRLLDRSTLPFQHRALPDCFYCPITLNLMLDPVISPEGYTYEREAISRWIRAKGTSPQTRNPLHMLDLRENNALYQLIQAEKRKPQDSIHPSIRRWQEAGNTSRRQLATQEEQHPEISITCTICLILLLPFIALIYILLVSLLACLGICVPDEPEQEAES